VAPIVIVTLDELRRFCRDALRGAGAPAGVDEEAARAAVWLEARGLPALTAVVAALDRWADDASAAALAELPPEAGGRRFEAAGRSAVFLAGGLMDLAVALAAGAGGGASSMHVSNVRDPWFFVSAAALAGREDRLLHVRWRRRGGAPGAGARVGPGPKLALLGDCRGAPPKERFDVSITCAPGAGAGDPNAPPVTLRQADLDARRERVLAQGLRVDDHDWARLREYAKRVLVPSSPESEARGAGSAASDNE
jgi:hypothetical protein